MKKSKINLIIKIALAIFMAIGQPFLVVGRFYMEPSEYYLNHSLEDIPFEEWKDIIGFERHYKISNMGRVKSLGRIVNRYSKRYNCDNSMIIHEHILKPFLTKKKYIGIHIAKDGVKKRTTMHIMVGIHFVPNPQKHPILNHKKGIKTDNRASQLEWCTYSYNNKHAYDTGLKIGAYTGKFGKLHHRSQPIAQFDKIGNLIKVFESHCEAGRLTGIAQGSISANIQGRNKTAGGFIWKKHNTL